MLTGRPFDGVGANYHSAGEILSQYRIRITEEDVCRCEMNSGLLLNDGQHCIDGPGGILNRKQIMVRSESGDRLAIIKEVIVRYLSGDPDSQLIRTLQREFGGGKESNELAGFGGNFHGAVSLKSERLRGAQGDTHTLQLIKGILVEARSGRCGLRGCRFFRCHEE